MITANICFKHVIRINSFSPSQPSSEVDPILSINPIFREGETQWRDVNELPKVTQRVSGKLR